jgi:hypothetical protein
VRDGLRAVGIVEVQHGRLRLRVGSAQAGRVLRVAFDLGGPPVMAFDEHGPRVAAVEHGRGEELRPPGHHLLGRLHVGHDLLFGLHRASGEAGQGERGAHDLHEVAPARGILELGGLLGELAVQELEETRRVGQVFEARPETLAVAAPPTSHFESDGHSVHGTLAAHRWHVLQEVRVWMP